MRNERDGSPQAVVACHELLAWIIPQLDKFPRVRRYTLGERIETGLLEVSVSFMRAADRTLCPAGAAGRFLERQPEEPPLGEPQQEHRR